MKVKDILNKATLQFSGGGELELSEYIPFISNAEDDLPEYNEPVDDIVIPDAYFIRDYFKSKNDMYKYKYSLMIDNSADYLIDVNGKIFNKDQFDNYISDYVDVFNEQPDTVIIPLYKDNSINKKVYYAEISYIIWGNHEMENWDYSRIFYYISNKPICLDNEKITDICFKHHYNRDFIEILTNLNDYFNKNGFYIYYDYNLANQEIQQLA